jgi:hydroxymethylpyrimidine/phosphomethylpyrimidine kinase
VTPRVLLVGGLDPSGGAGLTHDAAVVLRHGAHPLPVAVCLTAQNRRGFRAAFPVPIAQWQAALQAAWDDGPVHAIKTGMLAGPATVAAVAAALRPLLGSLPLLVDPVLSATAGGLAGTDELVASYREHLLPLASLAVPNTPELQALAGGQPAQLLAAGARAVLHKGGHDTGPLATDTLHTAAGALAWSRPRLAVGRVRGTGCALASAIAARLANGGSLPQACAAAGDWLARCLAALPPAAEHELPQLLPLLEP